MSPLISLLEQETKTVGNKHEYEDSQKNLSRQGCASGSCACIKPCANCSCLDRKER